MRPVNIICENEIKRLQELNPELWHEIKGHFNGMFGLDPCWLSEYLEVPDGLSLYDALLAKFGAEIRNILYKLCTQSADLSE